MQPSTHVLTLPGPMLRRGFWLYVWRVETPKGEMLYVGRTGDNSSPHATAPYTRMGQHLGFVKNQNALRRHLIHQGVVPEECVAFHLVLFGPIHDEVALEPGADRDALMAAHIPLRDLVGALEKALAEALLAAGYTVLNVVKWKHSHDPAAWAATIAAFGDHFPRLKCLNDAHGSLPRQSTHQEN